MPPRRDSFRARGWGIISASRHLSSLDRHVSVTRHNTSGSPRPRTHTPGSRAAPRPTDSPDRKRCCWSRLAAARSPSSRSDPSRERALTRRAREMTRGAEGSRAVSPPPSQRKGDRSLVLLGDSGRRAALVPARRVRRRRRRLGHVRRPAARAQGGAQEHARVRAAQEARRTRQVDQARREAPRRGNGGRESERENETKQKRKRNRNKNETENETETQTKTKTKRKQNETQTKHKRNTNETQTKRKTKRSEAKRSEAKRNEAKRSETPRRSPVELSRRRQVARGAPSGEIAAEEHRL